jgi:hypothetical protein
LTPEGAPGIVRSNLNIRVSLKGTVMPSRYWVVGGEYTDTAFTNVVAGTEEEHIGPFDTYEDAKGVWQTKAWSTVDTATRRYRIVEEPGPKKPKRYWVVGGEYIDTGFRQLVDGAAEERIGPFDTYEDAHAAWQKAAWASVDTATKRYRVVEETAV